MMRPIRPGPLVTILPLLPLVIGACASDPGPGFPSGASAKSPGSSDIIALVDSRPVRSSDLHDELAERAGSAALEEHILSDLLDEIARRESITITDDDIAREQESLIRIISDRSESAPQLIDQVRAARGLGPTRYPKLLRRNAILRALIADDPDAQRAIDSEIQSALDLARSDSAEIRLAVFQNVGQATDARRAILEATSESREWIFARVAAELSAHPSAPRGGYIARLRMRDAGYPSAITSAARDVGVGEVSGIVATNEGAALVYVISRSPGPVLDDAEVDTISRRARAVASAAQMEARARAILDRADIIVMDGSVSWSWRTGR